MTLRKIAASMPFAHLLGIHAATRADDDDSLQRTDESDEDYAKRMEEADEEEEKNQDKTAAEVEDEDPDEKEDKDKKAKGNKAKKAKGEGGSDLDDEDEDDADDKEKAARKSERARCAAIFQSPAAAIRPDMAAHLAFSTNMKVSAAVTMLSTFAAGSPKPSNLASRMSTVNTPNVGVGSSKAAAGGPVGAAAMIINAGKKRRGEV